MFRAAGAPNWSVIRTEWFACGYRGVLYAQRADDLSDPGRGRRQTLIRVWAGFIGSRVAEFFGHNGAEPELVSATARRVITCQGGRLVYRLGR
jgi:hypothetical protein